MCHVSDNTHLSQITSVSCNFPFFPKGEPHYVNEMGASQTYVLSSKRKRMFFWVEGFGMPLCLQRRIGKLINCCSFSFLRGVHQQWHTGWVKACCLAFSLGQLQNFWSPLRWCRVSPRSKKTINALIVTKEVYHGHMLRYEKTCEAAQTWYGKKLKTHLKQLKTHSKKSSYDSWLDLQRCTSSANQT